MPKPVPPSTGVVVNIEEFLCWLEELFAKEQPNSRCTCGTMALYSGRLKFTDEFIKANGLDIDQPKEESPGNTEDRDNYLEPPDFL
ncbi:MAG: hypothetical protein KAR12_01545 [Methylococcales bacterium]|nr:hypothetical protein [Methylococcales bacterium]